MILRLIQGNEIINNFNYTQKAMIREIMAFCIIKIVY